MANIQVLNGYHVKKIVTACPHCYNTLKNEYPDFGGSYEVVHHSEFLQELIHEGRLEINDNENLKNTRITYHDSCYLGRSNNIYDAPRQLIESLQADLVEMEHHRHNGLCCGAGGAQMFKEPEKGIQDINIKRTEDALKTSAKIIATACPFCMTMLSDGIKNKEREEDVNVVDIVELIVKSKNI